MIVVPSDIEQELMQPNPTLQNQNQLVSCPPSVSEAVDGSCRLLSDRIQVCLDSFPLNLFFCMFTAAALTNGTRLLVRVNVFGP